MTAMAATPLQKELSNITYEDVADLVCWSVHKFINQQGGKFEDLKPLADWAFVVAYRDWRPERGSFSNYVAFAIYKTLLENKRQTARKQRLAKIESADFEELEQKVPEHTSGFKLFEFLDQLGEDAQLVVKLVLDTPSDLMELMMALGGKPMNRRRALREHLKASGWTAARISGSFAEITTALTSA